MKVDVTNKISTYNKNSCILCGDKGKVIYHGLRDNLFFSPGEWTVKKCNQTQCGLMWLGTMPIEKDIPKLYTNYYTHHEVERKSILFALYEKIIKGYLSLRYGYNRNVGVFDKILGFCVCLAPGIKALADSRVFGLTFQKGGKLLEVGCGDGKALRYLGDLGWDVEGIDFDEKAIANAKAKGLAVTTCDLVTMKYPKNHFDAVVSKHVVEHIPDPIAFFQEVNRILKPGGKVVMYTPNSDALGHKLFKDKWRGLEPPRHLYVYNKTSLLSLANKFGFVDAECVSTYAGAPILLSSYYQSRLPRKNKPISIGHWVKMFVAQYLEWIVVTFQNKRGEEIVLRAVKKQS